jgi:hypothetical protein
MDKPERCIAQIGKNGSVIGAGFLIDPDHVMTCAHVINQCLGRDNETPDRPTEADTVDVRFPWATGEVAYKGYVVAWFPLPLERSADDACVDIAVLRLTPSAPEAVTPARLRSFPKLDGREVRTSGFPRGYKPGRPAHGAGWLFAQALSDDLPFLGGHSGAPMFLEESSAVVGMVSMTDDNKRDVGIFIPVTALKQAWPQLIVLPGQPRLNMAPPPPPDFVQRPHEFGALKEKLLGAKGDAVAITAALRGAGGYRKTTLAQALAHDPDIQLRYSDGVLWVQLSEKPQNLLSVVSHLIEILTGERPGLESLEAAASKLGEALGDRRILLVIDDAWRKQDLRPFLQGGRNTTRLITTRRDDILSIEAERKPVLGVLSIHQKRILASIKKHPLISAVLLVCAIVGPILAWSGQAADAVKKVYDTVNVFSADAKSKRKAELDAYILGQETGFIVGYRRHELELESEIRGNTNIDLNRKYNAIKSRYQSAIVTINAKIKDLGLNIDAVALNYKSNLVNLDSSYGYQTMMSFIAENKGNNAAIAYSVGLHAEHFYWDASEGKFDAEYDVYDLSNSKSMREFIDIIGVVLNEGERIGLPKFKWRTLPHQEIDRLVIKTEIIHFQVEVKSFLESKASES